MELPNLLCARAERVLVLPLPGGRRDAYLWDHTQRVWKCARWMARLDEFGDDKPNEQVVDLAAAFHAAGWAEQVRAGQIESWQVFSRPTSELQRETAIGVMRRECAELVPVDVVETAAEAIRQLFDRFTTLPESQVLAEAENLEGMGLYAVLRQLRQYQAEGRGVDRFAAGWRRQREYQYWEARLRNGLRFEISRQIARERLKRVDEFIAALESVRGAEDVLKALRAAGLGVP